MENDRKPPKTETAAIGNSDSSPNDDCRETDANQGHSDAAFVAAFHVSRQHDGSICLSAPVDGGSLNIVVHGSTINDWEKLPRLPIKDLANPHVALVVRPSLVRLVKAAADLTHNALRRLDGGDYEQFREINTALEPFADLIGEVAP
jgi:hypothetical protein